MDKGAYIYLTQNNEFYLFLFKKSSKQDIKSLFCKNSNMREIRYHDCITLHYQGGIDHIETTYLYNIPDIIKKKGMVDILNNNYETIKHNQFHNLKKKQFEHFLNFGKSLLS